MLRSFKLSQGALNIIDVIPSDDPLRLTIFVTDAQGNVALEHEGKLSIPLGNRSFNEAIGENGRINFPDITPNNIGDTIQVGLEVEGWEIANKNTFVYTGKPIELIVKRGNSLRIIKGVVKSRNGQEFIEGAEVHINTDTTVLTDNKSVFKIILSERMSVK